MQTTARQSNWVVAVDLGGTRCRAALVNSACAVVAQRTVETESSLAGLQAQIRHLVLEFRSLAHAQSAEVAGLCIGFPGVVHPLTQDIRMAPNIAEAQGQGLQAALQQALEMPVHLENDVNLAALAELHARADEKPQSLVLLSVGTGLGSGLVLQGEVWRGRNGGAGEIGTLSPSEQGLQALQQLQPPPPTATVEDLVSGKGLARLYQALHARSGNSAPLPFDYRNVPQLFERAQAGDLAASDSIRIVAQELAHVVAQLEHVLNPDLYVLGGGLGGRAEFRSEVNRALQAVGLQVQPSRFDSGTKAVPAQAWATAGQAGAAILALAKLAPHTASQH